MKSGWMIAVGSALLGTAAANAQQVVEPAPDPYVHRGTGFAFPAVVGPFVRQAVTEYDADATDVGANYELVADGASVAIATVYVFPLPGGESEEIARCRSEFDGAKQAIAERFTGAKLLREDSPAAPDPDAATQGDHAAYTITADFFSPGGSVESGLYLYCPAGSGWQVKYRTSAPAGGARDAAVQQFLRALPWPEKLGG